MGMTREQAIKEYVIPALKDIWNEKINKEVLEALEQEPTTKNCESCEYYGSHHEVCNYCYKCSLWTEKKPTTKNDLGADCISRQAVLNKILKFSVTDGRSVSVTSLWAEVNELPSVTQQEPRKGYWIYDYTSADGHRTYHCSECGCYLQPKHSEPLSSFKWCSLCGAKMVEPQESEDTE